MNLRRLLLIAYTTAVFGWLVWLVWLPVGLHQHSVPRPLAIAAALTYRVGGVVCHQDPARSFAVAGMPGPVCARCTGLYAGAVPGAFAALLWTARRRRTRMSLGALRAVLVALAVPTALLWLAEWPGGVRVGNLSRWAGALPLGAAVSWAIGMAIGGALSTDTRGASGVH